LKPEENRDPMTDSCRNRPLPLTPDAAEALAARLVEEMIERWHQGERLLPEDFLRRYPELWGHPEAAADLIYEELCLRQECGPQIPVEQVLRRFPQWRPQLEVLFDCQRVLGPGCLAPDFPVAGESVGDFRLITELGRGALGRVFLASQGSLGNRPVVLKLTPGDAHEHLSLARLQHTHIVPLYSMQEDTERGLRALCMPYFGGATLAQLLEALRPAAPAERSGQRLVEVLDRLQAAAPLAPAPKGSVRQTLKRASYVQAMCWIGACLADALQYAHERGLVHLDLKPSNVLLAADGQPMVLDFHLAHEPIQPGDEGTVWLGGTPGYMSPEQERALQLIQRGRPPDRTVDGRSDLYSLGVVLYEALGGMLPSSGRNPRPLYRLNPQVSIGLADAINKCLAVDPDKRYPQMSAFAADLRRHLADLPLAGVRNRSLRERWAKWQRRRPHGVALAGMMLAVLTAAAAVAVGAASYFGQRIELGRAALRDGQDQMNHEQWDVAVRTLQNGLAETGGIPGQGTLIEQLTQRLQQAEHGRQAAKRRDIARELHSLADRMRFLYGSDAYPPEGLRGLEACCRTFWEDRGRIAEVLRPGEGAPLDWAVRDDLLDLAIFWAELQVRLAPKAGKPDASRQALIVLAQAEELFGPSQVLDEERKHYQPPPEAAARPAPPSAPPRSAWELYTLGRSLLRSGDLTRAADALHQAVERDPKGLWPNFYLGLCAYRQGKFADAVAAYSVCIGAAKDPGVCLFNRGRAYAALNLPEQALRDYDQALRLDKELTAAAVNRGMLHFSARRFEAARADLRRARELGADPAVIFYDLALVDLALDHRAEAREKLSQALSHNHDYPEARLLLDSLKQKK
jgi:serine/threonine protein kinase/tetratricopeptide (TPR) repeat protein